MTPEQLEAVAELAAMQSKRDALADAVKRISAERDALACELNTTRLALNHACAKDDECGHSTRNWVVDDSHGAGHCEMCKLQRELGEAHLEAFNRASDCDEHMQDLTRSQLANNELKHKLANDVVDKWLAGEPEA